MILEIDIMNNLSNCANRRVLNLKCSCQCFKSTVFTMMAEFCSKHIKCNRILWQLIFRSKNKLRVRIDETQNKPGRAKTVNVDMLPRCPDFPLKILSITSHWRPTCEWL